MAYHGNTTKKLLALIVPLAIASVAIFSCGNGHKTASESVKASAAFNTLYEKICSSDDLAHADDEIRRSYGNGDIGSGQYYYLHAMVVYLQQANFDSVLNVCEVALKQPDAKDDIMLQYCIYSLMTNSTMATVNSVDMLQYACKTEELAKKLGETYKEQEMKATVGYGMVLMGHVKDGFRMIDNALAALRKSNAWNGINSYLIASKLKIAALDREHRYEDIAKVALANVTQLDNMLMHPETVNGKTSAHAKGNSPFRNEMLLYRTQMLAYITYAYAKMGDTVQAERYLGEFDKSEFSDYIDCQNMIVSALGEMKHYKRMLSTFALLDKEMDGDTLNQYYCEELDLMAREAASRGDTKSAYGYLYRANALKDTLDRLQNMNQMARNLSVYKVHDEQMKTQNAQFTAKLMFVIAGGMALFIILAVGYILRLVSQRKQITEKNKALVNSIERSMEYKDKYEKLLSEVENSAACQDKNSLSDANGTESDGDTADTEHDGDTAEDDNPEDRKLFELIDRTIRTGQLYLNPDFQRQTLVETLHVDRNRIGRAIRDCSGFSNLSAYINNYRLEFAYRLLRDMDSIQTIDGVSKTAGFNTVRTFQRLFKERYGMTPAEFRESYTNM